MALDGLLRVRAADVDGIVNGIDDTVWNPATDPNLAAELQRAAHRHAPAQQVGAAAAVRPDDELRKRRCSASSRV